MRSEIPPQALTDAEAMVGTMVIEPDTSTASQGGRHPGRGSALAAARTTVVPAPSRRTQEVVSA